MAKLAILGHTTRGKEVIEILEMLGGCNCFNLSGKNGIDIIGYHIGQIIPNILPVRWQNKHKYISFTLEEFLEKYPYKVGDKVKVCGDNLGIIIGMRWESGYVVYKVKLTKNGYETSKTSENLQPYKEETMGDRPDLLQQLKEYFENTPREVVEKEWHEYDKYNEIGPSVEEYLEYVSNIRQPQYPKTYEECAEILLERASVRNDIGYKGDLLVNLQRLLICRDAYWFIYNNWKPTHKSGCDNTIYTIHRFNEEVIKGATSHRHSLLEFPTEEMRDEFYENFKTLIFACKELI
jgi:hypothetical protein